MVACILEPRMVSHQGESSCLTRKGEAVLTEVHFGKNWLSITNCSNIVVDTLLRSTHYLNFLLIICFKVCTRVPCQKFEKVKTGVEEHQVCFTLVYYWWVLLILHLNETVSHYYLTPKHVFDWNPRVDLIGPFKSSRNGNRYSLKATDFFTRWVEAIPIQVSYTCAFSRHMYLNFLLENSRFNITPIIAPCIFLCSMNC